MAIPVRSETINVVKQLTKLEFTRDPNTGALSIESQYTTGYEDATEGFITVSADLRMLSPAQSAWALARKPSEGALTDPTLADFLTVLFDGIETGQIVLPQPPEEPPVEPTP